MPLPPTEIEYLELSPDGTFLYNQSSFYFYDLRVTEGYAIKLGNGAERRYLSGKGQEVYYSNGKLILKNSLTPNEILKEKVINKDVLKIISNHNGILGLIYKDSSPKIDFLDSNDLKYLATVTLGDNFTTLDLKYFQGILTESHLIFQFGGNLNVIELKDLK